MADNIYKTYNVPLVSGSLHTIDLPPLDDLYENNSYGSTYNRNGVTYVFDGSNAHDIELLQTPDINSEGITIPAGAYYVAGPFRRASDAPRYLKTDNNSDDVNISVIKITGTTTCTFSFTKL